MRNFARSALFALPLFMSLAKAQNATGTLIYFIPGLGACGFTNTSDQFVASVPSEVFDDYPGATANPNDNPICQHNVTVTYNGTSVSAQIVDYFVADLPDDVSLSPAAFSVFANISEGSIPGVYWIVD